MSLRKGSPSTEEPLKTPWLSELHHRDSCGLRRLNVELSYPHFHRGPTLISSKVPGLGDVRNKQELCGLPVCVTESMSS